MTGGLFVGGGFFADDLDESRSMTRGSSHPVERMARHPGVAAWVFFGRFLTQFVFGPCLRVSAFWRCCSACCSRSCACSRGRSICVFTFCVPARVPAEPDAAGDLVPVAVLLGLSLAFLLACCWRSCSACRWRLVGPAAGVLARLVADGLAPVASCSACRWCSCSCRSCWACRSLSCCCCSCSIRSCSRCNRSCSRCSV